MGFLSPKSQAQMSFLAVAWPQGPRRRHHIRILKSEMGHRCQSSGPLPNVRAHTQREAERHLGPLHHGVSDSHPGPQCLSLFPRPSGIKTHQEGLIFCVPGACPPRRPLALGQELLSLSWLMVAITSAEQRLGGPHLPPPLLAALGSSLRLALPSFQLPSFCPFSHSSPVFIHQRPHSYHAANLIHWPCLSNRKACPPMP